MLMITIITSTQPEKGYSPCEPFYLAFYKHRPSPAGYQVTIL
ncbi:hypothetical protein ATN83_2215 [Raoultella ornithinolytica]|nr:hypothetical protein ATN83_2215 [Raoultella ornithinolytica]